jgi:hypothetical protein
MKKSQTKVCATSELNFPRFQFTNKADVRGQMLDVSNASLTSDI